MRGLAPCPIPYFETLADLQVRILSLDPDESMKALGVQAVQAQPDSLLLLDGWD